ncbi:ABC transporter ATP-binding protein [Cohnella endophytica]|uniref:ABC transporter ATP-binding protein n=1 Tax=Cohnella endophytica TaxID=2419778 RepID=A0A494XYF6_9BACL|nr:ABC transporter ATP-binding protein [Cohnella endophytica]RKP55542.1 ABC transporter ATP-binding protein [Cohnella endophytica]
MKKRSAERMTLKDVSVYGENELDEAQVRLENITLSISAGEWLNVVGVNGSGKSTLVRLLAGLHTFGAVGELERGFAGERGSPIVLQQPKAQLFGETPREEIVFALEWRGIEGQEIAAQAERALERAGLSELADEPWSRLSGGQQQLAAIAAATASVADAALVVLDEVTSMLDESNRDSVLRMVRGLHREGTAIVWVTQRLEELVPEARVVALREGTVFFDGRARDFLYGEAVGVPAADPSPVSPCLRAGLRLPYLATLAIELRKLGKLNDPLPVTSEEWRKVMGNAADKENKRAI